MDDFIDAIMNALTYAIIAVMLTVAIVFLGFVLTAFFRSFFLGQ